MAPPKLEFLLTARNLTGRAVGEVSKAFDGLKNSASNVGSLLSPIGGALAALGAGVSLKGLIDVNVEFERLRAQLRAFSRDEGDARTQFEFLRAFAVETPFELRDLTDAWIQLRAAGLKPTQQEFRALGDLASALGKPIDQLGEAIRTAAGGSVERLNQFGVVARVAGDKIVVSFQGQTKTISRTTKAVQDYLVELSRTAGFTGAMARQVQTLGGAISNLQDGFANFFTTVGELGANGNIGGIIRWFTDKVTDLTRAWAKMGDGQLGISEQLRVMTAERNRLQVLIDETAQKEAALPGSAVGMDLKKLKAQLAEVNGVIANLRQEQNRLLKVAADNTAKDAADRAKREADEKKRLEEEERARQKAIADAQASALAAELKLLQTAVELRLEGRDEVGRMLTLEQSLTAVVQDQTRSLADRVLAYQQLVDLAKARAEAEMRARTAETAGRFVAPLELRTVAPNVQPFVLAEAAALAAVEATAEGTERRAEAERALAEAIRQRQAVERGGIGLSATPAPVAPPMTPARDLTGPTGGTVQGQRPSMFDDLVQGGADAEAALQRLQSPLGAAVRGFDALSQSVEAGFAAMVDGSMSAGYAFETAMKSAIAAVASDLASLYAAKAAGYLAEGIGGDPTKFAAAGKAGAASLAFAAISGGIRGSVNRAARGVGGVGGGAFGVVPTGRGLDTGSGEVTIVIPGGLLDMSDPRQADAFIRAMQQVTGRRMTVRTGLSS